MYDQSVLSDTAPKSGENGNNDNDGDSLAIMANGYQNVNNNNIPEGGITPVDMSHIMGSDPSRKMSYNDSIIRNRTYTYDNMQNSIRNGGSVSYYLNNNNNNNNDNNNEYEGDSVTRPSMSNVSNIKIPNSYEVHDINALISQSKNNGNINNNKIGRIDENQEDSIDDELADNPVKTPGDHQLEYQLKATEKISYYLNQNQNQ
mmetsp:Transcript_87660/g.107436  ORF Transcript_87660/g.107436 Transcript_87660/m.107436 type:complete len:203 (-) Transcript_87660:83-691(-)